jgi:hypothetical protein
LERQKKQVEGLWALCVLVGLRLERAGIIKDFDSRTSADIQKIISFLVGTKLWLRIEEAYPPFDYLEEKTQYDWSEVEVIAPSGLSGVLLDLPPEISAFELKSEICGYLGRAPSQLTSKRMDREPHHVFVKYFAEGKVSLFIDRGGGGGAPTFRTTEIKGTVLLCADILLGFACSAAGLVLLRIRVCSGRCPCSCYFHGMRNVRPKAIFKTFSTNRRRSLPMDAISSNHLAEIQLE